MTLRRNEILEIGNHIVLHHGFEFDDDTMQFMGVIIEKHQQRGDRNGYGVYMEDGDTNDILDWRILNITQFTSDDLDSSCIFMYEPNSNEKLAYKYRNLTSEEMSTILDDINGDFASHAGNDDDIPF